LLDVLDLIDEVIQQPAQLPGRIGLCHSQPRYQSVPVPEVPVPGTPSGSSRSSIRPRRHPCCIIVSMLRVASGDRAVNQGSSSWGSCGSASRWARSCGAMLACGTRIGIPRWLSDGGAGGAGNGEGAGGAGNGEGANGAGPAGAASAGIVTGRVSHGAVGHSASPVRAPGPGPASLVGPASTAGGGSRCRPVSDRGPLSAGWPAQGGAARLA